ncbi:MMPL family transporter [Streptomyces sp. NPDC051576]|uniref:MMPL family transporter n=1 Tax=Streptomyces sp. NPDC051576 TaxID=3155803 RepID=UPI0034446D1F
MTASAAVPGRSLLLPVRAILVGLLSLAGGRLTPTGALETSMPPLLFCIAFGLSVDYELLLLSRVKEHHTAHGDNRAAGVFGVAHTGRLVTASALVVAISMGAIVFSGITSLKVLGFGPRPGRTADQPNAASMSAS